MICLLVLTSHEGPLEAEIRDDMSGEYDSLKGAPRGLLPSGVAEKQIIDIWWDAVSKRHIFSKGANLCASALRSSWLGLLPAAGPAADLWLSLRGAARRWRCSVPDHQREQIQVLRAMGHCPRLSHVSASPLRDCVVLRLFG
jgi:hypothetical protein